MACLLRERHDRRTVIQIAESPADGEDEELMIG
jgi:hypothetical protein